MTDIEAVSPAKVGARMSVLTAVLLCAIPVHADVQFRDMATMAGVDASVESYGAAWGDLNGDGYPDLFVSNHRLRPSVYVNRRDGTFYSNSSQVFPWVHRSGADTHGGTWSDFDNDGDQDLLITTGTGNDQQLLVNERGDLVDRTTELGVAVNNVGGRLAIWMDFNRDARMDFLDVQFGGVAQLFRQTATGFVNDTIGSNVLCERIQYGQLLDVNGDGQLDIVCAHDAKFPRRIYSTFTYPLTNITSMFPKVDSVADSIVADFDNNGEMDVLLVSGTQLRTSGVSQPSARKMEALLSNGNKGFNFVSDGSVTVTLDWNKAGGSKGFGRVVVGGNRLELVSSSTFSLDRDDVNVQGVPPVNLAEAPTLRIGYDTAAARWVFVIDSVNDSGKQIFSEAYLQVEAEQDITGLQATGMWAGDSGGVPTLMLNYGSSFIDSTVGSGLDATISCVSAAAGDFDNDMDVDIYFACRTGASNINNLYFDNDGTGHFTLVPAAGGAGGNIGASVADNAGTADSVVTADYDVDGFLDLFVTNGLNLRPKKFGGPSNLFRNEGNSNNWIQFDLVGTRGTREPLGAIVRVSADGITQTRVVDGGYHRWSQNHDRIHVGLGNATNANVAITWPDGSLQNHVNVAANSVYTVTEGGNIVSAQPSRGVPYACGKPLLDADTDTGVYVWKECYLGVWRLRVSAAGETQQFDGQVAANADIENVNTVGWGNTLNLDDPKTLVFEIRETNSRLKGFNLTPGASATRHCLTIHTPAGTPVYYGPLKEPVLSDSLLLETGNSCDYVPPPPPPPTTGAECGDPGVDPGSEAAIALWRDCPGTLWHMRASSAGLGWSIYSGTIDSSTGFDWFSGNRLESADQLTLAPLTRLSFELGMKAPGFDGIDFVPSAGADTCFSANLPAGSSIVVGANRLTPGSDSFSFTTLAPCTAGP